MSAEDPASAQQRGTTEHRDPSEEHTTNANTGLHGKTVIHHHYASQPKTEPPKRKNLLGWLTATFAAIAAIIYGVQAVIFQNQLTVAREQLVSSSRAFVVFAGLNAFAFNSQGDGLLKWNIAPIIENSGNTPTVGLKAKATSCFRKDDLPRDFSFPDPATESVPIVLGPRQKSALGSFEVPGVFLPQIEAGTTKVYIYGSGTYTDIIKNSNDHHITRFCYLLNQFRGRPDDANSRIGYAPCWTHNCADAECEEQNTARANSEGQTDKVSCTVSVVIENR